MTKKHKSAAHTSKADRVIDALSEVRKQEEKPKYQCRGCGCLRYTTRRALGGPLLMICAECGKKQTKGSGKGVTPLLPENLNHKQGKARGPSYSATNKPKSDKHSPNYRSKGKGRPKQ